TGWWTARPVLLSFFAAGLITIGLGEATIKVVWLVLSVATLGLVYRLAVILFNKRVGVAAVALASVSYLDVFYSLRLLVDGPQVFFATLAAYLLVSSLQAEDGRHAAWGVVPAL